MAPNSVYGIDVNKYRGSFPFKKAKEELGLTFCYIRTTGMDPDGGLEKDPRAVLYHRRAVDAGLVVGAYHGLVPKVPVVVQANLFYEALCDSDAFSNGLPVAIDVEATGVSEVTVLSFLDEFWKLYETTTWMYTSAFLWHKLVGKRRAWVIDERASNQTLIQKYILNPSTVGPIGLWVADYRDRREPEIPTPWKTWNIWQYSMKGTFDGYNSVVDLDIFNGTKEEFDKGVETGWA